MKTVHIIRHAKSSWENFQVSDHERPILPKGEKRTSKLISAFKEKIGEVERIVTSTAKRTIQTSEIIARELDLDPKMIFHEECLYEAPNIDAYFTALYGIPNEINNIFIVGHNPTITDFVNNFIEPQMEWLPTSGIVSLSFKTDQWEEINLVECNVNFVALYRML